MLQVKAAVVHNQVVRPIIEDLRYLENKIEIGKDKENTTESLLLYQIHQDLDKLIETKEISLINILHPTKKSILLSTIVIEMIEKDKGRDKDKEELRKIKNILFKHHQPTIEQIVLGITL